MMVEQPDGPGKVVPDYGEAEGQALKPCPFCRSKNVELNIREGDVGGAVMCNGCGAGGPTQVTKQRAASRWNMAPRINLNPQPAAPDEEKRGEAFGRGFLRAVEHGMLNSAVLRNCVMAAAQAIAENKIGGALGG